MTLNDSLEQSFSFYGDDGVFEYRSMGIELGSDLSSGSINFRGAEQSSLIQALFRPWNKDKTDGILKIQSYIQETHFVILGARWGWFTVFLVFSSIWAILGAVVFKVKL